MGSMAAVPAASRGRGRSSSTPAGGPRPAGHLAPRGRAESSCSRCGAPNVCAGSFRLAVDEVPDLSTRCAPGSSLRGAPTRSQAGRRSGRGRRQHARDRRLMHRRHAGAPSRESARRADTVAIVDPIRNPYAPGAGQRPPELAGRDEQLARSTSCSSGSPAAARSGRWSDRAARGRQDGAAQRAALGRRTPPLGHRQARGPPRPAAAPAAVAGAAPGGARARPPAARRGRPRARRDPGVRAARGRRRRPAHATSGTPASTRPAVKGRADSGDIEIDLVELLTDVGGLAADVGTGVAVFIDEMQDLGPDDVSALCAACHEISQSGLPVIVVGAGLPHLPAVLSASKSYSERLFRYQRIDRLPREAADRALAAPAEDEGAALSADALAAMYAATGGYPYFIQAYGKAVWDRATALADHGRRRRRRRARGRGRAGGRLLRVALRPGHAGGARLPARDGRRRGRRTARGDDGARRLGACRPPTSPRRSARSRSRSRPARDALLKKGLDLLRRARPDRLHGAALRALPPRERLSRRARLRRRTGDLEPPGVRRRAARRRARTP